MRSDNWAVVKAALVAGYYPNLLRVDREARRLIGREQLDVRPHASSVLANHAGLQRTLAAAAVGSGSAPSVNTKLVAPSFEQHLLALPSDWLIYDEMARSPLGARRNQRHSLHTRVNTTKYSHENLHLGICI